MLFAVENRFGVEPKVVHRAHNRAFIQQLGEKRLDQKLMRVGLRDNPVAFWKAKLQRVDEERYLNRRGVSIALHLPEQSYELAKERELSIARPDEAARRDCGGRRHFGQRPLRSSPHRRACWIGCARRCGFRNGSVMWISTSDNLLDVHAWPFASCCALEIVSRPPKMGDE